MVRVGLDVDGVIRNFAESLIEVYQQTYPMHEVTPVEEWNEYPLHNYFPVGKGIYKFFQHEKPYPIYMNAPMYSGAQQFFKALTDKHEVTILSKQPNSIAETYTTSWLKVNKLHPGRLIYTNDKHKHLFDFVLEDCTDNLEAITHSCSAVAVCLDRPWNQDWKGLRVYNYEEFLRLLDRKVN